MTIREVYGLICDNSDLGSGLVNWYNHMIEKTLDELDTVDVAKMVRQDVLKEVALEKAIELFIDDPYDGEFSDGDLLSLIVSQNYKTSSMEKIEKIKNLLLVLESDYADFDWCSEEEKVSYLHNLIKLKVLYS